MKNKQLAIAMKNAVPMIPSPLLYMIIAEKVNMIAIKYPPRRMARF
jgi:hypothetical protein